MVKLTEAEGGRKTLTFTVVRPAEANPREGQISEAAPMGKAVLGRRVGDEVVAFTPGGERRYRIADARTALDAPGWGDALQHTRDRG